MLTYDTIKKLCKENGIAVTALEKELGFARGSLCKINTNKPSMEKVRKLADYFNVSVDKLLNGTETAANYYTDEETARLAQEMFEDDDMRSLFDMKRNMPPERFKAHIDFIRNLYNQEKGEDH